MMLDGTDRVQTAIQRLRAFEPPEGYFLAFSGGKDSLVIKTLADMAGVRYVAHYHVTTVDPPELVQYIREHHPDVIFDLPRKTMWELIIEHGMPPLRKARYCCAELKEGGGKGHLVVTGVRWAESQRRRKSHGIISMKSQVLNTDNDDSRRLVEQCYRTSKTMLNPIIDWSNADIWQFISDQQLSYCSLYDEGYTRLGCIGCPMSRRAGRLRDFARWPRYLNAYLRTFERMLQQREEQGKPWEVTASTAEGVMHWWLRDTVRRHEPGQLELEAVT